MNEIEKIKRYIERTRMARPNLRYDMSMPEMRALADLDSYSEPVVRAFLYGRAKGYRCGKSEARK